ncbi:tRNA sulfurtransferase [Haloarchaeobius sp. HME9146]|uniref:tRNA sulfurtransferase n=1 Tax=Haloarchaeobius sp. HME9146 TaxID=2978732 RepID=UPI0021BFE622|nr:tRNA sulfurtransferase [Haloarchaeobius sp. HME9146]MCT9096892.1 tRNA sulfurtransferase [Haloarchaeobius sp. HME9146]
MHPPGAGTVVVRHGDLNVKSTGVQRRMERRLVANVEALLADAGVDGSVEQPWSRILIRTDEADVEAATEAAARAFGVVSASPALSVPSERGAITEALAETAREHYTGGTFAVNARRAEKSLPFDSEDAQRWGGQAIWEAVEDEFEPEVDLDDPNLTFHVEIRGEETFVFLEHVDGPGGLPLGTQAPMVALVSGGIDSPVAAYELMRRGSPVIPVYVDLGDYGGPDHEARAIETVRRLTDFAPNFDLTVWKIPAGDVVSDLVRSVDTGRMLVFRRFLYMVGEVVAGEAGAAGVVTGEALGQKSSQTGQNFAVTSQAIDLPVHRPLLTWDKADIVERARAIGTFHDSTIPAGCNRMVPNQPETRGSLPSVEAAEPDDLRERAREVVERADRIEF